MKSKRLAATLGLVLGTFAVGAALAEEQGLRPLPEDIATQADEMTEETMPFPQGSLQGAPDATAQPVQDAVPAPVDVTQGSLSAPDALAQAMAARFARGDEDGNGTLTAAEVEALGDDDLVFARLDLDADGTITRDEWNAQSPQQVASPDDDE